MPPENIECRISAHLGFTFSALFVPPGHMFRDSGRMLASPRSFSFDLNILTFEALDLVRFGEDGNSCRFGSPDLAREICGGNGADREILVCC